MKKEESENHEKAVQIHPAPVLCALALTNAASAEGTGFTDVSEDAWYASAAVYCRDNGIMSGTSATTFSPARPMTRAMLAAVLYRLSGSPAAEGDSPFSDVRRGDWCGPAVIWTSEKGYMGGYGDGRFGPGAPVTREQLAAVLANYISPTLLTEVSAMDIMCQPCGVVAMADGSLLVTDTYNRLVWRVADGKSTICAGGDTVEDPYGQPVSGYHDAKLKESYFKLPWAIAPFLDGWAVSDAENNVVRLLRPEIIQTVNGRTEERLTVSKLGVEFRPTGLATDSRGNLCVSDTLPRGPSARSRPRGT